MAVIEKKKLGRKATLSPEEIIATIKQMQKDGDKISPSTIRGKITFGGLTNITSVLESFLEEQSGTELSINDPIESHLLPPDLEDKVNMLISGLSVQLNNFALESDLLANNIAEKRARSAYDTMIENNKNLVDEQSLTIKIFDEVEAKNSELVNHISNIEIQLLDEQKKLLALDKVISKANDELDHSKLQISDIQTSLATSADKNHSLEKLITKAETRLESSITDKEIAVNESIKFRTQLTEITSKLKSSDAMTEQLKSDISALNAENEKSTSELQSKNSKLLSELETTRIEQHANKEKLITITTQYSGQKDVLKEKDGRITDLKNQLTELKTIK